MKINDAEHIASGIIKAFIMAAVVAVALLFLIFG